MPRAWLCARGNDLPFALTTEQLDELGYGNISTKPFTKIAPLIVAQKPLTDEEMVTVYSGLYGAGTERENLIEMGRAVERAHGIGEKKCVSIPRGFL